MNYRMIGYTLGWLLMFEAGFLVVPFITSFFFFEWWPMASFLITMIICGGLGFLMSFKKPEDQTLYAKDGLVIVALSWIVLSLFGALPFVISGSIPNYIDAFFEIASGFTTTGSSIIPAVEDMPKCILMWRSFSNWVGGMGVLVFIMAFLPLGGAQNLHIMRAESPGPTVSKLVPKMKTTAFILYLIYFVLTVIMFIVLMFDNGLDAVNGKMEVFEALCTSFSTAGTGGFGFLNDSFAGFSNYIQIVVTVFLFIFSINFSSYFLLIKGRFKDAINQEVRVFLLIAIVAVVAVALNIYYAGPTGINTELINQGANSDFNPETGYSLADSFKHAAFNVASIISTCGFGTENFVAWPELSQVIIGLLMFIGGCAGSTAGGLKVSRLTILIKGVGRELKAAIHPRQVKKITIDNRPVDDEVIRSVNSYITCYIVVFVASLLLISIDPFVTDLTTGFTAVSATLNNIGPGLGAIGPASNFAGFSWFSKLILSFDMIAGRLELIPMLLMFAPSTWKKN